MNGSGLLLSSSYWGGLWEWDKTILYGYFGGASEWNKRVAVPTNGACYGYVGDGAVRIVDGEVDWTVGAGQYFSFPSGFTLELKTKDSRIVVVQQKGFRSLRSLGGPIESRGRLRYIDGCSDTLLISPPVKGDPCQNLLHFPKGILQTAHSHPSLRCGLVARGQGYCHANGKRQRLSTGDIFAIGPGNIHHFETVDSEMDVIAYHPDSDFGPTHEDHPMVNRTLVNGIRIDNSQKRHSEAVVIDGRAH